MILMEISKATTKKINNMENELQKLVGQPEEAVRDFIAQNKISNYRIIPDDMCGTCDYIEDRLTVWLDENNNVAQIGFN